MARPEALGLLLALCCVLVSADKEHCAWYGECGRGITPNPVLPRTCVANNIVAQPINNSMAEDTLQKRCPHFFENDGLYIFARSVAIGCQAASPLPRIIMRACVIARCLTSCRITDYMLHRRSNLYDG